MVKKRKTVKALSEFPDFDKMPYEQEAKWWKTHDLSAIWDKLEKVELEIAPGAFRVPAKLKRLSSVVNIRLGPTDHQKLRLVANRKALGVASLVRMWILERLHHATRPSRIQQSNV